MLLLSLVLSKLQLLLQIPIFLEGLLSILEVSLRFPSAMLWTISNPFNEKLSFETLFESFLSVHENALNFILKLILNDDGHGWNGSLAWDVSL